MRYAYTGIIAGLLLPVFAGIIDPNGSDYGLYIIGCLFHARFFLCLAVMGSGGITAAAGIAAGRRICRALRRRMPGLVQGQDDLLFGMFLAGIGFALQAGAYGFLQEGNFDLLVWLLYSLVWFFPEALATLLAGVIVGAFYRSAVEPKRVSAPTKE